MTISHLLLAIYHRLEPQPTHRTTIIGTETHRDNFRNFDRPVQHDKRDFLTKIARLNTILAIGHLRNEQTRNKYINNRVEQRDKRNTHNTRPSIDVCSI